MTASAPKPRIILADDHRAMLEQLSRLLEREFEIVAAVTDGTLAVERVADLKPDAVLLDINMPGMGGIEAAQHLRRLGSPAKIIILSIASNPDDVRLATAMSASYVVKSRMRRDLLIAIREALAGRLFVSSPAQL
jgi:DNA-binding NarL/FixJ family response regulator